MSTPISNFREAVRVLTDDNDPDIKLRENAQIDAALRTVLDSGRVINESTGELYTVDATRLLVTPDLVPGDDPDSFVRLTYYAAQMFVNVRNEAWRTRAFSEISGQNYERIMLLYETLYQINSGGLANASEYPL